MRSHVATPLIAVITTFSLGLVGCGGEDPPSLPPEDSMALPDFFEDNGGALTLQAAGANNVVMAKVAVAFVTAGVHLALVMPRIIFAGALQKTPTNDDGTWVWQRDYPVYGFETELRGKRDDGLHLEMHVSKVSGLDQFDDFIWYDGDHHAESGVWNFYEPGVDGPVLQIDWARASATDKDLVFTAVKQGDTYGDSISYSLDGTTASMTLHDAINAQGIEATFSVQWDTADGSGMMVGADEQTFCWDTLANGQVDIPCP